LGLIPIGTAGLILLTPLALHAQAPNKEKTIEQEVSRWFVDFAPYFTVLAVLVVGLIVAKLLGRALEKMASERIGKHVGKVGGRVVYYVVLFLALLFALSILNIKLATVLAAAGVLTIAIGFAAQTSLGNMISGLMLLGDRPFQVDDFIEVEDKSGFVVSIDLLSTKLRTLDNTLVRIPNETLIKSTVRNVTRYSIRRLDIDVGVTYSDDLELTHKVLQDVARKEILVLEEPRPVVLAQRFGDSSIDFTLRVWVPRKQFLAARSNLVKSIKRTFDEHGITIAFPHRTLYIAEVPELKTAADGSEASAERPEGPPGPPPRPAKEEIDSRFHRGDSADAPDLD
jgi:small-conductance mechanosensitive channel